MYLSLGVSMLRMRQGRLADTAALASDLKASLTTLITCRCNHVLSYVRRGRDSAVGQFYLSGKTVERGDLELSFGQVA